MCIQRYLPFQILMYKTRQQTVVYMAILNSAMS